MRAEQEVGNIPFNAEVIPPIVLTQPYEGGYEGDMDHAEINEGNIESADEEDETSITDDTPMEQNATPSPGERRICNKIRKNIQTTRKIAIHCF